VVADLPGAVGNDRRDSPRLGCVEDLEGEQSVGEVVEEVRLGRDCDRRLVPGRNASVMSSASLRKSSTNVSVFSGWIRLSRESVCTAASPTSTLSTNIVCRSGWS
jgi:hypothetical protein